MKKRKSL
jgi:hypothetical protein